VRWLTPPLRRCPAALQSQHLFRTDKEGRLTTTQLLEHPWIDGTAAPTKRIPQALASMHKRWLRRKLKAAVNTARFSCFSIPVMDDSDEVYASMEAAGVFVDEDDDDEQAMRLTNAIVNHASRGPGLVPEEHAALLPPASAAGTTASADTAATERATMKTSRVAAEEPAAPIGAGGQQQQQMVSVGGGQGGGCCVIS
jgi:hypothetical protein